MEFKDALLAWIDVNETLQVMPLDERFKVEARADDELLIGLFLFHLLLLLLYLIQIQFQHIFIIFYIHWWWRHADLLDPAVLRLHLASVQALQFPIYFALLNTRR